MDFTTLLNICIFNLLDSFELSDTVFMASSNETLIVAFEVDIKSVVQRFSPPSQRQVQLSLMFMFF